MTLGTSEARTAAGTGAPAALILAGGEGTRVRHLLGGLPKPLAAVAGRPFLAWVVSFLRRQGLERFAISAGYRADAIAEWLAGEGPGGGASVCVREETPLGTGGAAAWCAHGTGWRPLWWLVANGDSLVAADLAPAFRLMDGGADGVVVAARVADASRYGTLEVGEAGRLLGFAEKRPGGGAGLINAGIYLLREDLLRAIAPGRRSSMERDLFPGWIAEGRDFRVFEARGAFLDIGTPDSLAEADAFIAANRGWFLPGKRNASSRE